MAKTSGEAGKATEKYGEPVLEQHQEDVLAGSYWLMRICLLRSLGFIYGRKNS